MHHLELKGLSPCILLRASQCEKEEQAEMKKHFPVYGLRTEVPAGSLVIGRFSVLPYHRELEQDVHNLGSRLINSSAQHDYVANFDYYEDLRDVTFPTWFNLAEVPYSLREKAFVVKGRTNSKKQSWAQLMYASDFVQASKIAAELRCDGLLGQQGLVIRQYVPLETFETSEINGMPFSNEWRIFYYQGRRLAYGYYWSIIDDWSKVEAATPDFLENGLAFADEVATRLVDKIPFVVIDVAKTAAGEWKVVELNDGCQSGLNDAVSAELLYSSLNKVLSSSE